MPAGPDLNDERAELVAVLREVIERNRYFMSPRVKRLRAILDKLEPPRHGQSPTRHRSHRDNIAVLATKKRRPR